MSNTRYIFTDTQHSSELERLHAIEQFFDSASRRRIQSTGITTGWHCLEVGAGAGSMTRWMAETVGHSGQVVAIDLDTRFLEDIQQPNITVLKADIRTLAYEPQSFDLIHARYVLIHLPDFQTAFSTMLTLLKPGGWLVVEEPDFSAARAIAGTTTACQAVERVTQAIMQMFADKAMDPALGIKLPAIVQQLGLHLVAVENEAHLAAGGSEIAAIMNRSTVQLRSQYLATGKAQASDLEQYCQFATDPNTWAIYYSTVGVVAQVAK
jgi:2-polyprenyl-3-methyl-5-hydroxy-6-metoxy-1,4-benzoquinol methylase